MAAALLTALHRAGGIKAARALYHVLLPLPPPGGDFFRSLLQLEMEEQQQAAGGGATAGGSAGATALSDRQLQDLFETATDAYGATDPQLWLLYAEWQGSRAGAAGAGGAAGVYWKARKALIEPGAFEAAYQHRFKLQPTTA